MGIKFLLGALLFAFVCTNVRADELVYDVSEATYYGSLITTNNPPADNLLLEIFGTPADEPFPDEWLQDVPEVLDILGTALPTSGPFVETVGRHCAPEPCNVFQETFSFPTNLPLGFSAQDAITIDTTAVTPEPSTWLLFLTGTAALGFIAMKRWRVQTRGRPKRPCQVG